MLCATIATLPVPSYTEDEVSQPHPCLLPTKTSTDQVDETTFVTPEVCGMCQGTQVARPFQNVSLDAGVGMRWNALAVSIR